MTSSTPPFQSQHRGFNRRNFLTMSAAGGIMAGSAATFGAIPASASPKAKLSNSSGGFRSALSVSPFTQSMLAKGLTFTDGSLSLDPPMSLRLAVLA
ncbi:twin-arginine translocation signal domain-containing protein [Pseudarthrobacter sp. NPDC092184]|uniref:twin-arginine translocation signal domain-containing protein n=1 Tax=unclassified Pseudarthrobacter TaxID=2647000 RepID=UPI00382FB232